MGKDSFEANDWCERKEYGHLSKYYIKKNTNNKRGIERRAVFSSVTEPPLKATSEVLNLLNLFQMRAKRKLRKLHITKPRSA